MSKWAHVLYCQMMVKSEKCNSGLDSKCLKWNLYFNISTDLEFCCNFITICMCNDEDWFDMRQKKMDLKTTFDRSQVKVKGKNEFTTKMSTIEFPK
jgi:hypothetical protein